MKKHLLPFALIFFLTTQTKAQTSVYHPFPDSNAYWTESYGGFDGSMFGATIISTFIKGDTTIGGIIYHKCYENGYYTDEEYDTTYFNNLYRFALRQDTSQKKVFIFGYNAFPNFGSDSTESLLYDFNLSLGDTLPASVISPTNSNYVTSVDSINSNYVSKIDSILVGNDFRKRFWVSGIPITSNDTHYFSIIEGIGSDQGLTDVPSTRALGSMGQYSQLYCFNQNGQTLWLDTADSYWCAFQTGVGINELSLENFISLYPNPATNQLTIHASSFHKAATVSIMNVLGQTSPPTPLQMERGAAAIDVSELPSGIYFIQLTTEKERWVGKFVKE